MAEEGLSGSAAKPGWKEHRLQVGGASTYLLETCVSESRRDAGGTSADELPTVLLLHGNPDSSRLWHEVVARLEGCRCLVPDLPGFGLSRITGEHGFRLEDHVAWLDGVLEAPPCRDVDSLHLVVHDFGGPYGLSWAVRHPRRVRSVLASDTIYMSRYRWHFWARLWRTPLLGEISMPLMGRRLFEWELRRGSKDLPGEHIERTWELVTPSMKRTVLALYRATDPRVFEGWEDELRQLLQSLPSLALWGEYDPYIAASWAAELGARQVEVVPGAGHWLPAEKPDLFADRLRRLIEAC